MDVTSTEYVDIFSSLMPSKKDLQPPCFPPQKKELHKHNPTKPPKTGSCSQLSWSAGLAELSIFHMSQAKAL